MEGVKEGEREQGNGHLTTHSQSKYHMKSMEWELGPSISH